MSNFDASRNSYEEDKRNFERILKKHQSKKYVSMIRSLGLGKKIYL